ncbi:hypothetical protein RA277_27790, partial [Pseudomonas syringae pv. tagetis]
MGVLLVVGVVLWVLGFVCVLIRLLVVVVGVGVGVLVVCCGCVGFVAGLVVVVGVGCWGGVGVVCCGGAVVRWLWVWWGVVFGFVCFVCWFVVGVLFVVLGVGLVLCVCSVMSIFGVLSWRSGVAVMGIILGLGGAGWLLRCWV